jgi:hypothetical protein
MRLPVPTRAESYKTTVKDEGVVHTSADSCRPPLAGWVRLELRRRVRERQLSLRWGDLKRQGDEETLERAISRLGIG